MDNNQPPIPEANDLPPSVTGQEVPMPEVSVSTPQTTEKPAESVPAPKPKGKLIPILLIILILSVLGVGGTYAYKNFFAKAPESTPTPVSTPESTPDPTADWETYTNTAYGFTFKYPSNWVDETDKVSKELGREFRLKTEKNEYVNGILFDKIDPDFVEETWTKQLPISDNKVVVITYTDNLGPGSNGGVVDLSIFDQILSTFKFTEKEETPSIFDSYSIQIPTSWNDKYVKKVAGDCDLYDFKGQTFNSTIFSICKVSLNEWSQMQNSTIAHPTEESVLAKTSSYVYYKTIGLSNDYSGNEAVSYQTLSGDITSIIKTFNLK